MLKRSSQSKNLELVNMNTLTCVRVHWKPCNTIEDALGHRYTLWGRFLSPVDPRTQWPWLVPRLHASWSTFCKICQQFPERDTDRFHQGDGQLLLRSSLPEWKTLFLVQLGRWTDRQHVRVPAPVNRQIQLLQQVWEQQGFSPLQHSGKLRK